MQPKHPEHKTRQVRDAEATKAQILEAAMEEFAKHGLSGARTEAIAKTAGVTTAMIYYYFESKEGLYQTVLHRLAADINIEVPELSLTQLPAEEALKRLIEAFITYEAAHPYFSIILWQEALQNQGKYYKDASFQVGFNYLVSILERGMAEGCFRKLDPFLTAVHINGMCTFYFDAYNHLKYLNPGSDLRSPEMINNHMQEVIKLILGGVRDITNH
ncbi:TetR/AcrR family transcriptional regulator [Iningainema tapete]|uniref:TetR/AcrR family transcriptional regulator n=1 Tax=Iningainema tapete BLCC-T55 TaxID=2748662 RepID=A0A8J7BZQ5_9CYAN|nr:TetR/AcrR family transcriptional regulator [Iningainema tapete]MBD2778187.1 TetR/AcrR family transcriptional regulator [Iningainema tapete BLCC-T55]